MSSSSSSYHYSQCRFHYSSFITRQTFLAMGNVLCSIKGNLSTPFTWLADFPTDQETESSSPPFDPSQPSLPISYPLKTLQELSSRAYFSSFHYPFNVSSVPLRNGSAASLPDRGRVLVCHDMQGGYTDNDKWVQGGSNENAYGIWHWYLIDVFVYFSHNLVTLPPPCWTNAAHQHGVKVLGTFIAERDEGAVIMNELLSTKESAHMYADRLVELAAKLGFDGWLLNMEVTLDVSKIPNLLDFVNYLTETMHSSSPGSLVIWYDSITTEGQLIWQNQLNDYNKPFFDKCDGIFVNYSWQEDYPKLSASVAGDRKLDVYMGIDVFGRNTYGGGQWNTNLALDLLKKDDISTAIFAPGWVYETNQPPDFETAQNRWWSLVETSWGILQKYPQAVPFYSNFDQGRGYHVSIGGSKLLNSPWSNISFQTCQPFLAYGGNSIANGFQVLVDLNGDSYNGGGNITFKGTLEDNAEITTRLFIGELPLGDLPLHFTHSVKSDGNSQIGLALSFSSASIGKESVLLASSGNALMTMNRFSSKFSKLIMPHRVTKSDTAPGWIIEESSIAMNGFALTEIHAVCYRLNPELSQETLDSSQSAFHAVLGHITIKSSDEISGFPPSTSWLVEGGYINWTSGDKGSKTLSVKINWSLKDGSESLFLGYNIYVEKVYKPGAGNAIEIPVEPQAEYLGVAHVQAFYVSQLAVDPNVSSLKFVIQVRGFDGSTQELDDSPSFHLAVEN